MSRLTALVCVRTEDWRLAACLERLRFADELVVVLDRCSERYSALARRFADRVIVGAFPTEGSCRTAGIEACNGDWILEINADEQVGPALAEEIRDCVDGAIEATHFVLPIDHYAGYRLLNASAATRLCRRDSKSWRYPAGRLVNPLVQQSGDTFPDKMRRVWRTLKASHRSSLPPSHGQAAE